MRKIKFRGKRVDNGEWYYGFFREFRMLDCWKEQAYRNGINYYIDAKGTNESHLVIPESVGQFTGLYDKNGKEIYESDIVIINGQQYLIKFEIGSFMLVRCSGETDMYDQFKDCWNDDVYPISQYYWNDDAEEDTIHSLKVIGNIYENPEFINNDTSI